LGGDLFLGGLLLSAVILAISPRRPALGQLLAFVGFAALGLRTSRGIIWFGLVMAPILADHLAAIGRQFSWPETLTDQRASSGRVNAILAGLLLLMAAVSLPWFKEKLPFPPPKAGLISAETPLAATQFLLDSRLPGQVFHAMSFGSYLIWKAQPEYPIFVDSRIELYAPHIWLDYLEISQAAPGWEARLEGYHVQTLMLSPVEQPALIQAASASPRWQRVYQDAAAVIFVAQPAGLHE
jgi:hypothetical protein